MRPGFYMSYALSLLITCFLTVSSCRKDNNVPKETTPAGAVSIHNTSANLAGLIDNTAALQQLINAGNVVLPKGHAPYTITSLTLVHSLNLNGNTINCISQGSAINMSYPNVSCSNGTLAGISDLDDPSGAAGIYMTANHDSVSHMYIHNFPAYGIVGGDGNAPVVANSKISEIGYMGIFFDSENHNIFGGIIAADTVDQSMMSAATIAESAMNIRGSSTCASSQWSVHNNRLIMPYLPLNWNAECFELRYAPHSVVDQNICIGGSIGISVVRTNYAKTTNNVFTNQNIEALEYADSNHGYMGSNNISSQVVGVLLDGANGCNADTLSNNVIWGCASYCMQFYFGTHAIFISGGSMTMSAPSNALYLQGAHGITLNNVSFVGGGIGTVPIVFDTSAGNLTMNGGSISGFTQYTLYIYSLVATTTNNIYLKGVTFSKTPKSIGKYLKNNATVGTNISL
jgi:hypothetical protein